MANEAMSEDLGEDVELEATPRKQGMSGKKIVLFIVLPLLLVGAALAVLFGSGLLESLTGDGRQTAEQQGGKQTYYHELPTMLVNLNNSGGDTGFLKLTVSLALNNPGAKQQIKTVTPRIVDSFQVYLRELRVSDLEGSAGMQRLREELLLRVNNTVEDARVKDVLFKEMLVQ
jgi:flagellar FliL protein